MQAGPPGNWQSTCQRKKWNSRQKANLTSLLHHHNMSDPYKSVRHWTESTTACCTSSLHWSESYLSQIKVIAISTLLHLTQKHILSSLHFVHTACCTNSLLCYWVILITDKSNCDRRTFHLHYFKPVQKKIDLTSSKHFKWRCLQGVQEWMVHNFPRILY